MAKHKVSPVEEIYEIVKKLLILELFRMNVPQAEIAKKVRMDLTATNSFLKGIKRDPRRK